MRIIRLIKGNLRLSYVTIVEVLRLQQYITLRWNVPALWFLRKEEAKKDLNIVAIKEEII